jgi:hypothetical protein
VVVTDYLIRPEGKDMNDHLAQADGEAAAAPSADLRSLDAVAVGLGYDNAAEALDAIAHKGAAVCDLWYCESQRLVLHPGRLYRFKVDPKCATCTAMKQEYDSAWNAAAPSGSTSDAAECSEQPTREASEAPEQNDPTAV